MKDGRRAARACLLAKVDAFYGITGSHVILKCFCQIIETRGRTMTKINGRTVRLFLVDGSQSGLVTAEIINWTGHVLIAPRSNIGEALKREEVTRTGVYFLVGEDPEQPTKSRVYVGEADVVADRIKMHAKDESKDFWTRACFVTSKDPNITKAHVRYLESRIIEMIKAIGRANLANGNEPSSKSLPESDVADMEFFLEQIELILPVVGFEFLRPISVKTVLPMPVPLATLATLEPTTDVELEIISKKHDLGAWALSSGDEFIVIKGSHALKEDFKANSYKALRDQLIADRRLILGPLPQLMEFAESVPFASPSAAAAVIFNRNTNGRTAWRVKGTDMTLREWQDSQLQEP